MSGNVVVWVGNLRPDCTPQQLQQHCSQYKPFIHNKPVILSPKNPQSSNYRYSMLHLCSMEKAKEFIEANNGKVFQGRKLSVKLKEKKGKSEKSTTPMDSFSFQVLK